MADILTTVSIALSLVGIPCLAWMIDKKNKEYEAEIARLREELDEVKRIVEVNPSEEGREE